MLAVASRLRTLHLQMVLEYEEEAKGELFYEKVHLLLFT